MQENCKTHYGVYLTITGIYLTSLGETSVCSRKPRAARAPPRGRGRPSAQHSPLRVPASQGAGEPRPAPAIKEDRLLLTIRGASFLAPCLFGAWHNDVLAQCCRSLGPQGTVESPGRRGAMRPSPRARRGQPPRPGTSDTHLPASLAASAPLPRSSPTQMRSHPFNKLPRTPINKPLLISPFSEIARRAVHHNGTFSSSSNDFDRAKLHSTPAKLTR